MADNCEDCDYMSDVIDDLHDEIERLRAALAAEQSLADQLAIALDAHYGYGNPMTDPTLLAVVHKYIEARQ